MVHVPYKDQSQMYVAIANRDVDWAFSTVGSALPLIKAGRIKVIAVAAKKRAAVAPDVPTVEEAGGPAGFEIESWVGVVAPRGTPQPVIRQVNADINRLMADLEIVERMNLFGFDPAPMTPEEMTELIRIDRKNSAEVVKRSGATAD
jgi:tripartite-type tricarboxylate transporter receptor subunit TctC